MNRQRYISFLLIALTLLSLACHENKIAQPGICISFDDRTIEAWHEMRELLNEYDAKVTFFITEFDSISETELIQLMSWWPMDMKLVVMAQST